MAYICLIPKSPKLGDSSFLSSISLASDSQSWVGVEGAGGLIDLHEVDAQHLKLILRHIFISRIISFLGNGQMLVDRWYFDVQINKHAVWWGRGLAGAQGVRYSSCSDLQKADYAERRKFTTLLINENNMQLPFWWSPGIIAAGRLYSGVKSQFSSYSIFYYYSSHCKFTLNVSIRHAILF